jgi:hypothetical protein
MIEDIVIAVALLIAGAIALVLSGRGSEVRRGLNRVVTTTRSLLDVEAWRRKWLNPLLRLGFLLLLLIMAGWAATLSQVGIEATQKAISFEHPTSPDVATCYHVQRIVVRDLEGWADDRDSPLKPGPLDPMLGWDCPGGGTYSLDKSGVLTCSRHGSAPDNPPLLSLPFEEQNQ